MNGYSGEYACRLEDGKKFQKYIINYFWKEHGMIITEYSTKEEQKMGENSIGFEFKNDKKIDENGKLYIEFEERYDINKPYYPSGIFRNDNTWLWFIGDHNIIYVIPRKWLQKYYKKHKEDLEIKENNTFTSRGFLLKISEALEKDLIIQTFVINKKTKKYLQNQDGYIFDVPKIIKTTLNVNKKDKKKRRKRGNTPLNIFIDGNFVSNCVEA